MLLTGKQYKALKAFGGARFAEQVIAEYNQIARKEVCSYCGRKITGDKSCPGCGARSAEERSDASCEESRTTRDNIPTVVRRIADRLVD